MPGRPAEVDINEPSCREILNEETAVLVPREDGTSVPIHGDMEIKRAWTESVQDKVEDCLYFLETFTSAKNSEPQWYVDDPKIGQHVYEGRWRHAFSQPVVTVDGKGTETIQIVQTLRRGYIETLVTGSSFDWTEARLQSKWNAPGNDTSGSDDPEEHVTVTFPSVAPDHLESIVASIEALSNPGFTPVIHGETQGTDMYYIRSDWKDETDGSATLILYLGHPRYSLTAYRAWNTYRGEEVTYHWNVPKGIAQSVIDAHATAPGDIGSSASVSYQKNKALVDIILAESDATEYLIDQDLTAVTCDYEERTVYYWGSDEGTMQNIALTEAPNEGVIATKTTRNNGNGTFDVVVRTRTSRDREEPQGGEEYHSWTSAEGTHYLKKLRNQPSDTLPSEVASLDNSSHNAVNFDMNQDCTTNWTIHKTDRLDRGIYIGGEDKGHFWVNDDRSGTRYEIWIRYTADKAAAWEWVQRGRLEETWPVTASINYMTQEKFGGGPPGNVRYDQFNAWRVTDLANAMGQQGTWVVVGQGGGYTTGVSESKYGFVAVRVEKKDLNNTDATGYGFK